MNSGNYFKVVDAYKDKNIDIPIRSTKMSAGYDLASAEDIVIPSLFNQLKKYIIDRKITNSVTSVPMGYFISMIDREREAYSINEIKKIVKELNLVTMIPTGLKVSLEDNLFLSIHPRSSIGINCLLMLANQTGIIDADYYDNPDNEGHIFIPMINLSPYDIKIQKGDRIAQGIIQEYKSIDTEIKSEKIRGGGCGSTGINEYYQNTDNDKFSNVISVEIDNKTKEEDIYNNLKKFTNNLDCNFIEL